MKVFAWGGKLRTTAEGDHSILPSRQSGILSLIAIIVCLILPIVTPKKTTAQVVPDCVKFLADVSIQDWEVLQPGSIVQKTWRVKNCGAEQWHNRQLVVRYGESPEAYTAQGLRVGQTIAGIAPVPELMPGEEGEVSILLHIPNVPGNYKLWFDIVRADEQRDIMWVFWKVSP